MADSVTIVQDQTSPTAPPPVEEAQDNSSERPDWLPEKFTSPEDLAKSYAELEKKLSSPQENASETDVAEQPQSEAPVFDKFATEFADKGELSTDSFSELEKMGYPKEMVETYIKGMTAAQTADVDAVMQTAGGNEGYTELTEWAKTNMDEKELNLYNSMVATGTDNAKMAVEWLMSKREAIEGVEPTLITGKARAASKDEFRSTAEVVSAMKDERYGKDPAYTKDIEQKLARSNVF